MSCNSNCAQLENRRSSTLPPPCYHCRPLPFCCPEYGCPPPEPYPPIPHCSPPCLPLTCRSRPEDAPPPPTICVARPCPEPPGNKPPSCPPAPKQKPPLSCVRFCIRYTCEGSTYYPCYSSSNPRCTSRSCC